MLHCMYSFVIQSQMAPVSIHPLLLNKFATEQQPIFEVHKVGGLSKNGPAFLFLCLRSRCESSWRYLGECLQYSRKRIKSCRILLSSRDSAKDLTAASECSSLCLSSGLRRRIRFFPEHLPFEQIRILDPDSVWKGIGFWRWKAFLWLHQWLTLLSHHLFLPPFHFSLGKGEMWVRKKND